jgi:hypothetical protein
VISTLWDLKHIQTSDKCCLDIDYVDYVTGILALSVSPAHVHLCLATVQHQHRGIEVGTRRRHSACYACSATSGHTFFLPSLSDPLLVRKGPTRFKVCFNGPDIFTTIFLVLHIYSGMCSHSPPPLHHSQGPDVTSSRNVSAKILIEEIPHVMRALGFYPSEQEVSPFSHPAFLCGLVA